MATFIFNNDLANRIAAAINETSLAAADKLGKTAREIAKELGEDKHVINQHLYRMSGVQVSLTGRKGAAVVPMFFADRNNRTASKEAAIRKEVKSLCKTAH